MEENWRYNQLHLPTIYKFLQCVVEDYFPSFKVHIANNVISILAELSDQDWHANYKMLIMYQLGYHPKIYILEPNIQPNRSIHMYKDKSLCLYHTKNIPFILRFNLVEDIIPWSIKWIHYYEIWRRNGNLWIGPEVPHA